MTNTIPVTVAYGDGIGPEIMEAVLAILRFARAPLAIETVEVGKRLYEKGFASGFSPEIWQSLNRTKLLFKAPITTPQGGGYKSLNVTLRAALGLYANIRPCLAYSPYVPTNHPKLNLVIVRENEEDLYTGIEYRQTPNTYESLKLISHTGSERIIRYAFDYAKRHQRHKVSCFSKDNIMKMTDGIFHKLFNEIAKEYPEIKSDHYIIDIGSARLADKPELFDVIVTSNLYGDIISDIAAEVSGSVGLAGSANIGEEFAMFEAIHGSAPDIAGQNIANPSGLLQAAVMMLVHLGLNDVAQTIHHAWLRTLEDGIHTADIYSLDHSKEKVGTKEFAEALIKRLGKQPKKLAITNFSKEKIPPFVYQGSLPKADNKQLVGIDVFVQWESTRGKEALLELIEKVAPKDAPLQLQAITAMGTKIWPSGDIPTKHLGDHWRLRFVPLAATKTTSMVEVMALLQSLAINHHLDVIKTEHLYLFGDVVGFSAIQD